MGGSCYDAVVRLQKLPRFVQSDADSIRDEIAPYVGMTPAELWRVTEACARDAIWAARASGMLDTVLARRDPLPRSTIEALARLRRGEPAR